MEARELQGAQLPGLHQAAETEVCYLQANGIVDIDSRFRGIQLLASERTPNAGFIGSERIEIRTPNQGSYFAIEFGGDLDGWRNIIHEYARLQGLMTGKIVENFFYLEDGTAVALDSCRFFQYLGKLAPR